MQNPISDEQKVTLKNTAPSLFGVVQSNCYQMKHSIYLLFYRFSKLPKCFGWKQRKLPAFFLDAVWIFSLVGRLSI